MAVEMIWYRVKCDWCRSKVDMQGTKSVLPFGWIEDDRQGIQFMTGAHFCREDCLASFRAADRAVVALSQEVARQIGARGSELAGLDPQDFTVTLHHRGFLVQEGR